MIMKNIISENAIILLALLLMIGCSESYLEEQPPHIITGESLYTNSEGFEIGLNGLYALVRMEREGRSTSGGDRAADRLRAEMFISGTDNMCTNHRDGWGRVAEPWGDMNNPFNAEIEGNFEWLYEIVNAANTLIERAQDSDVDWGSSSDNKNRIVGEAKALRAWAYRHLTFTWGDVPLTLEESKGSNIKTDWERIPVSQVREQMKSDLLFAEEYVGVEPSQQGRITKGAVQTYLAELYLTLNKPDSALIYADKCISTPNYQLVTSRYGVKLSQPGVPFMDMFYDGNSNREEGNTEALWVWQWEKETIGGGGSIMRRWHTSRYNDIKIGGVTPLEVTVERGGRPRARMSLTKFAIDLYEPQDDRFSNYVLRKFFILKDADENDTGTADVLPSGYDYGDTIWLDWSEPITYETRMRLDWPFLRKYEWADPLDVLGSYQYNDQVYMRLAETYLLKAEAQYKLDDLPGAATTLNIIRQRSNASSISPEDVTLDFILDERSRELALEEHRRHTLLRTGKWLERTRLYNLNGGQNIVERDTVLPIPQNVIDANLTKPMSQNPGY